MTFILPPLPYRRDALAPHVSAETLDYHHGKHHAAYVEKLNKLVSGTKYESHSLEDIMRKTAGSKGDELKLFHNAAQHWNHSFFWHCLSPTATGTPAGDLADGIREQWGSLDAFKKKFREAAIDVFGTGWTWLVQKKGKLEIIGAEDADNPLVDGARPLLTCDVWEHAYYIDYRNDRGKYVDAFWKLADWKFASKNMGEEWSIESSARATATG
jgi:Fe-Mn family superoxide dismutase